MSSWIGKVVCVDASYSIVYEDRNKKENVGHVIMLPDEKLVEALIGLFQFYINKKIQLYVVGREKLEIARFYLLVKTFCVKKVFMCKWYCNYGKICDDYAKKRKIMFG